MESPTKAVSAFAMYSKIKRSLSPITNGEKSPRPAKKMHGEDTEYEFVDTSQPKKSPKKRISDKLTANGKVSEKLSESLTQEEKTPKQKKKKKRSQCDLSNSFTPETKSQSVEKMKKSPRTPKSATKKEENNREEKLQKMKKEVEDIKNSMKLAKSMQNIKYDKDEKEVNNDDDGDDEENKNTINPLEESATLFSWLIHPLPINEFFECSWEKAPLHIQRSRLNYYKLIMSTPTIDQILRKHIMLFTKNIDITSYSNGKRETHNPEGRALPTVVWDYYLNGCSVRLLNPQTYIPKLHSLNATLQEFFGCFVGANCYLTPQHSQGFAPHYDDIEAFILQIEGKKRWRLYNPRNKDEVLPRVSSKNFDQSEIGKPILDIILEAGDLLYFPRGIIHQAETVEGFHSLHVTLSVYQKNSWGDYLEKLLPLALKSAISLNKELREGLPPTYLNDIGYAHSSNGDTQSRKKFNNTVKELLHKVIDSIDIDKAADQLAKEQMHDFLPPVLAPVEHECSVLQDGERMIEEGEVIRRVEIDPDSRIRLTRSHCARLVQDDDSWRIYYSTENSKEYHALELQSLDVDDDFVPAIKEIISRYPEFIRVDDLPICGEDNKVQIARDLWEKCIVVTDIPLPIIDN